MDHTSSFKAVRIPTQHHSNDSPTRTYDSALLGVRLRKGRRVLDASEHVVASELEELDVLSRMLCIAPPGPSDLIVLPTMDFHKLSTMHFSCVLDGGETLKLCRH